MVDKEFLKNHAEHRNELEDELRRYELLNGISFYKSPSNTDGMPHGSGGINDRVAEGIIRKTDSCDLIRRLEQKIKEEETEIEAVLELLPKAKQKTVIRIKYYHQYDWDDVALFLFGNMRDYAKNMEKYKAKAQKLHGTALANIKKVQQETKS